MLEADPLIVDTAERVCADLCSPEIVNAAEDGEWPAQLWEAMESTGLALAWVPESCGGAGVTLADGFAVARATARHAVPLPVAETLLAGWLLGNANLTAPAGPMTVAPTRPGETLALGADGTVTGEASGVPFAGAAAHLVAVAAADDGARVALVPADNCQRGAGSNLAGEPLGQVRFDSAACSASALLPGADPHDAVQRMGAALRSQQMAGALEHILALSLDYARERSQFGRPIARFQAVQHNLATLAGETAAAGAAADAAASAIIRHGIDDPRTFLAVAAAKVRAGEAAGAGAAIAHQVHGAMGFTREYRLHQSTRRLWAWRDDFGPESTWAARLGRSVVDAGARALWPSLTSL